MRTTRRRFLGGLGAMVAATGVGVSGLSLAAAPTDRRLVVVLLRGGMDGLAAVPPWGDPDYAARGKLALAGPDHVDGVIDLDGSFGLHPALAALAPLYDAGELAAVHAAALPYRERSHFDAQDLLETGVRGAHDGWLNRALGQLDPSDRTNGIAIGRQVPMILRGEASVTSVDPARDDVSGPAFLDSVAELYAGDPLLGPALEGGLDAQRMVGDAGGGRRRGRSMARLTRVTGAMLAAEDGPRVAVFEAGGWDTHANQGTSSGRLASNLSDLGDGIAALADAMGDTWRQTVLIAVSEFGRTVHANGTGGSDHGTAGVVLLAGGAVAGGRVIADWPGLAARHLHEGRDLRPTTDVRSVFKGVLGEHLGLDRAALEEVVFPDSLDAAPFEGLVA